MVNEKLITAIRLVVRDEVVASEQRTAERFDKMDEHFDKMDERLVRIETAQEQTQKDVAQLSEHVTSVDEHVISLEAHVVSLDERMTSVEVKVVRLQGNMERVEGILDKAVNKIKALEKSQISLENKIDDHIMRITHEMEKLTQNMRQGWKVFGEQIARAIVDHERTPINKTHPPTINH